MEFYYLLDYEMKHGSDIYQIGFISDGYKYKVGFEHWIQQNHKFIRIARKGKELYSIAREIKNGSIRWNLHDGKHPIFSQYLSPEAMVICNRLARLRTFF